VSAAPAIDILTSAGMSRFDGSAWSTLHPDIAVFDGQFVADNIHSGEVVDVEHKRNLYRVIIGDDGVRLAEEDAALAAESRAKTSDVTAAVRALNLHLPSGMKVEAYVALAAVADIDVQIAEQEKKVASIAEAATISARAGLSEFPAPALDAGFGELLRRTLDDVAQDAEQQLATHLTSHSMAAGGAEWIATGVEYARGDDCPFCGQDIRALPLVAAFRSVFSDSYKTLKQDIADRQTTISRQFGDAALARFDTIAAQNKAAVEFWTQHCTFEPGPLQLPEAVVPAARSLGAAALALLGQKLGAPLDAIEPDAVYTAAVAAYEPAQQQLATANQAIRTVNGLIAAKKAETATANLSAAQPGVSRCHSLCVGHTKKARMGIQRDRPKYRMGEHEDEASGAQSEPDQRDRQQGNRRQRVEHRGERAEHVAAEPRQCGRRYQHSRGADTKHVAGAQDPEACGKSRRQDTVPGCRPKCGKGVAAGRQQQGIVEPTGIGLPKDRDKRDHDGASEKRDSKQTSPEG
jgi:hypothetical protein